LVSIQGSPYGQTLSIFNRVYATGLLFNLRVVKKDKTKYHPGFTKLTDILITDEKP
jgi:hypothetical protein